MVIVVEIENRSIRKPFLGGWRDPRTRNVYHNAETQTLPRAPKVSWELLNSRETQTSVSFDKSTECSRTKSCQTFVGMYVPSLTDRYVKPRKYERTESKLALEDIIAQRRHVDACARRIQKCYRAYRIRAMIRYFAGIFRNLMRGHANNYRTFREEYSNRKELQIIKSTSPRTREDFDMLYELVDRWRQAEIERVNQSFARCSKMAAHAVILQKEIELLRSIDKLKTSAKKNLAERRAVEFLNKRAKPIEWTGYKGHRVSMETLRVQKSKEYKAMYEALSRENTTREDRVRLLVKVRHHLNAHRCDAVLDLTHLIDQELNLIARNIHPSMLTQLRSRLKFAFLYFVRFEDLCKAKCYPDDAVDYAPLKTNDGADKGNGIGTLGIDGVVGITRLCARCNRILPLTKFSANRQKHVSVCAVCEHRAARSSARGIQEPYEEMLRCVRRAEARKRSFDSVAFVMGPEGISYLVNVIWHGKSGISECDDLEQLTLVRFHGDTTWAPWNSLVLTKREAMIHDHIEDLNRVYSKSLVEKFVRKNLQARLTFKSLDIFADARNCVQRT